MRLPHERALAARSLYSAPPPAQDAFTNNPTLLVSWWCTCFALVIILVRLGGRWIRTEKLFIEDKIMALSIVPLLARMSCAHWVIRWGTNNVDTTGLDAADVWRREVGSQLVLPARILYAALYVSLAASALYQGSPSSAAKNVRSLWTAKLTIAEFLRRLYSSMWKRSWELTTVAIRWFLALTFMAVVVATLTECRPFPQYWQVVPDPGPHCRQGFVQLITMGVSDTITDLVLVAFPVPVILASSMPVTRKMSLCALFALSLSLVAITIYRVTATVDRRAEQQFRSLVASFEILAAAAVANALVLGSFVRDRGAKKAKYKLQAGGLGGSDTGRDGSLDRPPTAKARTMRALSWGSDHDLAGDFGFRLGPDLHRARSPTPARPAPAALAYDLKRTRGASERPTRSLDRDEGKAIDESDVGPPDYAPREKDVEATAGSDPTAKSAPDGLLPRRMSFFDVGGLLDAAPSRPPDLTSGAPHRASVAAVPFAPGADDAPKLDRKRSSVSAPPRKRSVPLPVLPSFASEMRGIDEAEREDAALRGVRSAD